MFKRTPLEAEAVPQGVLLRRCSANTQQICKTCLKEHHWQQKQSLQGVLLRFSANMQQICNTTV